MIALPIFNPDIVVIAGVIHVKWYGFMYVLGFVVAWLIAQKRLPVKHLTESILLDYFSYFALGIIVGGRLGYMLIYGQHAFMVAPWSLFAIWQGGMAFHGALIGGLIATMLFAMKRQIPLGELIDFTAPLLPPGLMLGRLGNFINGELWGRVTQVAWAMIFPYSDGLPRHPSQLYAMLGEGLLLYYLLDWHRRRNALGSGLMGCWFLIHYGWIRFVLEFYREPDAHMGFVLFNYFSMGQCLCFLMCLAGLAWWCVHASYRLTGQAQAMSECPVSK